MRSNFKSQRRPKKGPAKRQLAKRQGRYPQLGVQRQPYDELKQTAISLAPSAVFDGTAGRILVDLTALVTQGTTDSQRLGDHLYLDRIEANFLVNNQVGATSNPYTTFRVFFFQYFGDSAVAPTIANMLLSSAANAGPNTGSMSQFDIDHQEQYKVCYDSGLIVTTGTNGLAALGVGNHGQVHAWKFQIRNIPDRNIRFYAAGADGPNHIFVIVTTDQATIAVNPTVSYSVALRFTDA
jgi:hypothetical protein